MPVESTSAFESTEYTPLAQSSFGLVSTALYSARSIVTTSQALSYASPSSGLIFSTPMASSVLSWVSTASIPAVSSGVVTSELSSQITTQTPQPSTGSFVVTTEPPFEPSTDLLETETYYSEPDVMTEVYIIEPLETELLSIETTEATFSQASTEVPTTPAISTINLLPVSTTMGVFTSPITLQEPTSPSLILATYVSIMDLTFPSPSSGVDASFIEMSSSEISVLEYTSQISQMAPVTETTLSVMIEASTCHSTVKDCPLGHMTTNTIDVYTTVCPTNQVEQPAATEPAHSIGVLVTIVIEITVQISIHDGVTDTLYYTQTLTSDTKELYDHATLDQPCYTCQITSAGYECPSSDVTVTRTLVLSSTSDAPSPEPPLVFQTCSTCSGTTLTNNIPSAIPTQADVDSSEHPKSPEQSRLPNLPANGTLDHNGSNYTAPNISNPSVETFSQVPSSAVKGSTDSLAAALLIGSWIFVFVL
ncbi:hypothetical protein IFR05_009892 [Cadophora sp. M221]|nr:hypothetical protein IFR05_009892 [Cadophora sp. M221]